MASKRNKSYTYLLPMVGDEALEMLEFVTNTYIKDVNDASYRRRLYLKCLDDKSDSYNRFEEEVTWSPYYEGRYAITNEYTMIIFNVPNVHYDDYDKIVAGKYSKVREDCKQMILNYHDISEYSYVYGALYKKEYAYKLAESFMNKGLPKEHWTYIPRTQEPGSIMDIKLETFSKVLDTVEL